MCVLALAWKAHQDWPLLMIGNRDELHSRPTAGMERWDGPGAVIAGRDLQSGGTWAGVSEEGRFAVVTNRTGYGAPDPERASRGALIRDFLTGEGGYARAGLEDLDAFNPFNMISIEGDRALYRANRPEPVEQDLAPGVHGLTNGPIAAPWPRSLFLTGTLEAWLAGPAEQPVELFEALLDGRDRPLPSPQPDAPFRPEEMPVFIRNPVYGSRCSTLLAMGRDRTGVIAERRFDAEGRLSGETTARFTWPT